jgi:cystathionine beta-lyase/cystathionine gamma-synthase
MLPKYGIEVTFMDFKDLDAVKKAFRPTTKMLYTETVSNPMLIVVDIEALAEIANATGAKLTVDNTFTTSRVIRPLEKGADISINSLTKFANGHSDAVAGSLTGSKEIVKRIYDLQVLLGCTLDGFTA